MFPRVLSLEIGSKIQNCILCLYSSYSSNGYLKTHSECLHNQLSLCIMGEVVALEDVTVKEWLKVHDVDLSCLEENLKKIKINTFQ